MPHVIVVDDGKAELGPMTDLRAAFDIRTGALTNLERLTACGVGVVGLRVPERLAAVTRERHPGIPVNEEITANGTMTVNGRWPAADCDTISESIRTAGGGRLDGVFQLERPWHVKAVRDRCLAFDLEMLSERVGAGGRSASVGVFIAASAAVHPTAILDAERGQVVIDEHAVVRPGAIIVGPAYVGPHSVVLERALIKGGTAIGPSCKVAGEVGGTIFQGYANKGHDGHLGDSWVGEWANLGAGTTNSNLLNTYGEVVARARPGMPMERTGEQFFGCVVGDHVKTAICTRIMTGAVIGTGVMWAASAAISGCVPAMSWVTDAGTKSYRFEKFMEVARAAMKRRGIEPSAAVETVLRGVHAQAVAAGGAGAARATPGAEQA